MITLTFIASELAESLDDGERQQLAYQCLIDLEVEDIVETLQHLPLPIQRAIVNNWAMIERDGTPGNEDAIVESGEEETDESQR